MKKFWNFVKNPPLAIRIILLVLCIFAVAASITLVTLGIMEWYSYLVFALASLLLAFAIYIVIKTAPHIKQNTLKLLAKNKHTARLVADYGARTAFFAVISLAINVAYSVFHGIMAIINRSIWLGSITVYYLLLTLIRFFVLLAGLRIVRGKVESKEIHQRTVYRNCGICFLGFAVAISAMLVQMIMMETDIHYHSWTIYAVAAYTFYKVIVAIVNAIKVHKTKNYVFMTIRNINLVTAGISIMTLQVALINSFGGNTDMSAINIATGCVIGTSIVAMGVLMTVQGAMAIKKQKSQEILTQKGNTNEQI